MAERATLPATEWIDHAAVDRAHARANEEALLEHARLGRSVCESRNGQVVWVTPEEIFAHFGLDENGKPTADAKEKQPPHDESVTDPTAPPDDPLMTAQVNEWREAERWDNEGRFKEYRGEYVFFGAGIVFGHGRNLVDLRPIAEAKAAAAGVPPERVVDYFVPGE